MSGCLSLTFIRKVKTPGGSSAVIWLEKSVSSFVNIGSFHNSFRTANASSLLAEAETEYRLTTGASVNRTGAETFETADGRLRLKAL